MDARKTLISLAQADELSLKSYGGQEPIKNGIACPQCGRELLDTTPNLVLTSYPPKKNIHCGNCEYKGYRYA